MSSFDQAADRINAAVEKAENGSNILYSVANGDDTTEVQTTSGPVPSIQKWFKDNKSQLVDPRVNHAILEYGSLAEATEAAKMLPDGQQVISNNEHGSLSRYSVLSGSLDFIDFIPYIPEISDYESLYEYSGESTIVSITSIGKSGFIQYDSSDLVSVSDGGTIFVDALGRRWKRHIDGPILLSWFLSGNTSDETLAIQSAINAVSKLPSHPERVLLLGSGNYNFKSLIIPEEAFGLTVSGISAYNSQLYCTDTTNTDAIRCYAQEVKFSNIGLRVSTIDTATVHKIGINFDKGIGKTADIDATIDNCRITGFYANARINGRGLRVSGGLMSLMYYGVMLDWPNIGEYIPGESGSVQDDAHGFRAIKIDDVRMHSFGNAAIANIGANASKLNGLQVTGIQCDIGRRIFTGHLGDGAQIADCLSGMSPEAILTLTGGSNYTIDGIIGGGDGSARTTARIIEIRGNHKNGSLRNLTLSHCTNNAIDIRDGICEDLKIDDVDFNWVCTAGGTFNPIGVVGPNQIVDVNNVRYNGTLLLTGIVRGSESTQRVRVTDARSNGSATPATTGAATTDLYVDKFLNRANNWFRFLGTDGTLRGTISYAAAGTSGVTVNSESSLNLGSATASIRPMADGTYNLGTALWRFGNFFVVNAPTVTSDEREKTPLRGQTEAERAAALEIKSVIGGYQFRSSIEEKGEARARVHWGVGAQTVENILRKHGLDPAKYGFLCYDEWEELPEIWKETPAVVEDGVEIEAAKRVLVQEYRPAGQRYGIRYSALAFFILAAI